MTITRRSLIQTAVAAIAGLVTAKLAIPMVTDSDRAKMAAEAQIALQHQYSHADLLKLHKEQMMEIAKSLPDCDPSMSAMAIELRMESERPLGYQSEWAKKMYADQKSAYAFYQGDSWNQHQSTPDGWEKV